MDSELLAGPDPTTILLSDLDNIIASSKSNISDTNPYKVIDEIYDETLKDTEVPIKIENDPNSLINKSDNSSDVVLNKKENKKKKKKK